MLPYPYGSCPTQPALPDVSGLAHLPDAAVFEAVGGFLNRAEPGEGRVGRRIGWGKRHLWPLLMRQCS